MEAAQKEDERIADAPTGIETQLDQDLAQIKQRRGQLIQQIEMDD